MYTHQLITPAKLGSAVSNTIVSVVSLEVLSNASFVLIYTVLVASPALNVRAILELHDCRFVGLAVFQKAICTHDIHASVGQVILSITPVEDVYPEVLFIENDSHDGAVPSYT